MLAVAVVGVAVAVNPVLVILASRLPSLYLSASHDVGENLTERHGWVCSDSSEEQLTLVLTLGRAYLLTRWWGWPSWNERAIYPQGKSDSIGSDSHAETCWCVSDMAVVVVVCSFVDAKATGRDPELNDVAAAVAVRSSADGIGLCVRGRDDAGQAASREEQASLKEEDP